MLIAYLDGIEPIASLLAPLIESAQITTVVSTICVAEILAFPAMQSHPTLVHDTRDALARMPGVLIRSMEVEIAELTASIRARTSLKLPDAAIVATAVATQSQAIIGNDRRWNRRDLGVSYLHMDNVLATP